MIRLAPFKVDDLRKLDDMLSRADAVVPMREIAEGETNPNIIGMRHDVDNYISPAVAMAEWEAERGYRSTYFILHTAPYWALREVVADAIKRIQDCGHEIGFHVNAISAALMTGGDPIEIVRDKVAELREYAGEVVGVVAHGDPLCHTIGFVNDEIFTESPRPDWGEPNRDIGRLRLAPVSRSDFGFTYDPNWLPRAEYISDSGGAWSKSFTQVSSEFPFGGGQLHMLVHPDWWSEAFAGLEVHA